MREIKSLTAIRGVFALYVAVYHIFPRSNSFIANGYLSVDLFFILSGFIMSYVYQFTFSSGVSIESYTKFLKGRIARIYPLYFFLIVIISILYIINGIKTPSLKEYSSLFLFFQSFYVVPNNLISHAWSIAVEVLAYFSFPFVIHKLMGNKISAAIFPVIYMSFGGLALVSMNGYWGPMDVGVGFLAIVRCLCEYGLGIVGYIFTIRYQHKLTPIITESILITSLVISFSALNNRGYDLVAIAAFALIIPTLSKSRGYVSYLLSVKPMVYLGEISYSIYLVHYPLCRQLVLIPTWIHNKTGLLDVNSIALIMTIIISIFTYHIIEVPCRNLIKRIDFNRVQR
ncbi:acyltransferase family protein [Erwinia billingiae]|uniref:acyltransferase family protein n=1 Tax=Erwinia billingiae TaxID=182337 RepID=UPI002245ABD5|nr:acyltransferase [Erwinia billingiae]MCX0500929.1 acyltransferase [Erwinia billingiae]